MAILGPISSSDVGGERGSGPFYISFVNVLYPAEFLTGTPTITPSNADVTISDIAINAAVIVDGDVEVPIGEAIQFRATVTDDITDPTDVELTVHWGTNTGSSDTAIVKLRVEATLH